MEILNNTISSLKRKTPPKKSSVHIKKIRLHDVGDHPEAGVRGQAAEEDKDLLQDCYHCGKIVAGLPGDEISFCKVNFCDSIWAESLKAYFTEERFHWKL